MGKHQAQRGRKKSASSARWARRLQRKPNDVEALYGFFDARVREAGVGRAVRDLRAVAGRPGAHAGALVVGYCLFGAGLRGEAVEALREAHRQRPREPTLYALSSALTVTGRPAEARRVLEEAAKRRPLTARPLVSLANAHLAEGDKEAAARAVARITPRGATEWADLVASARTRVGLAPPRRSSSRPAREARREARAKAGAWIEEGGGGAVVIRIKAHPGARVSAVKTVDPWRGALVVDIAAPAQDGEANDALTRLLADRLGVPRAAVTLVRGARSHDKAVRVEGVSVETAKARLEAAP